MKARKVSRSHAVVLMVDVQERLLPAVCTPDLVLANSVRLARASEILNVPFMATEQYPKGLGPTVPPIKSAVRNFSAMEKLTFSACGAAPGFPGTLKSRGVTDVILCGIEAHVCVLQTCLDLLAENLNVFIVADAVSSRSPENLRLALDRMRNAGAIIASTEMVLFELLGQAGTPEFKQVQDLVK